MRRNKLILFISLPFILLFVLKRQKHASVITMRKLLTDNQSGMQQVHLQYSETSLSKGYLSWDFKDDK